MNNTVLLATSIEPDNELCLLRKIYKSKIKRILQRSVQLRLRPYSVSALHMAEHTLRMVPFLVGSGKRFSHDDETMQRAICIGRYIDFI